MDRDTKLAIALYGAFFAAFASIFVVRSHWEAEAYTRLTGKQVSTWDAMFLDLRVQEPIQD